MNWRASLPQSRRDFLLEQNRTLAGWLQVDPKNSIVKVLLRPSFDLDIAALIATIVSQLPKGKPVLIPVRDYQEPLRLHLEECGFEMVGEHALLSRSLAIRVPEPRLVPARARAH